MNKTVYLLALIALCTSFSGCKGKDSAKTTPGSQAEQKVVRPAIEKERALAFLLGMQAGDTKKMYEAANLTAEIVADSREKLIHQGQNKLTDLQRKEFEHALRISGDIDFLSKKMKKIITKTANLQIIKAVDKEMDGSAGKSEHTVKVVFATKEDALTDKTGKTIKELNLHLVQITRTVGGRLIHEFSFDSKDFDKMADREFEVVSYF